MNCPNCNTPNAPDSSFCKQCGQPLAQASSPPAKPAGRSLSSVAMVVGGAVLTFGVLITIVGLTLFLVSRRAGSRLPNALTVEAAGATLSLADGAQLTLPPEGMQGSLRIQTSLVPAPQFLVEETEHGEAAPAAAQLPPHLKLQSPVYRFERFGRERRRRHWSAV